MSQKTILTISGMHCSSCAKIIEGTLEEKAGVTSVKVDYDAKKASIEFDQGKISIEEIKKEIEGLGYKSISY